MLLEGESGAAWRGGQSDFSFCWNPGLPGLFFFFKICLWLHWVFVAVHGLSLVSVSRDSSLCGAQAAHCSGFPCCGAQAPGMRASQ